VVALLATKGRLRDGRSVEQTTDVLLTVYGDESYQLLRSRYGWTNDQVMAWLADVLPDIVLDPAD